MKKALWRRVEGCSRHLRARLSVKPLHDDLMPDDSSHGAGLTVDNFVKNFFLAVGFEYSGIELCAEIYT